MNKVRQRNPFFMKLVALIARPIISLGLNIRIKGLENIPRQGPAILAANHFSWWEPPSIIYALPRPVYFIAANDFRWDIRISWIVRLYGTIPVDRTNFEKKTIITALQKLKDGQLIGIFPQGGMMQNTITDAKPGVVFLAHKAGVPIIPIGISGQIDPSKHWKKLRRPRITVRIGSPFSLEMPGSAWKESKQLLAERGNELMAHIAALVDPEYRGAYADHPVVRSADTSEH